MKIVGRNNEKMDLCSVCFPNVRNLWLSMEEGELENLFD